MREIDRLSEPTAYSNADFIAPQALVISDGKPFKSPAVNTVASTFWYYVASTIFTAGADRQRGRFFSFGREGSGRAFHGQFTARDRTYR